MELTKAQRIYVNILFGWVLFSTTAVALLNWAQPIKHAVTSMGFGLVLLWVVIGGSLMWRFRYAIVERARKVCPRVSWQIRFVLFCTVLALTEEAITTSLTNSAPLFGLRIGQAYITASSNYLDTIALHGVTLFVSFFVGWAVLLTRWKFSPFAVWLLFGITGTLVEVLYSGSPFHLLEYGMWAFVYGLMIWLPGCAVPEDRPAKQPRWYVYPLAVFIPLLFVFLFPLLGVISLFFPHHPKLHFPPMS